MTIKRPNWKAIGFLALVAVGAVRAVGMPVLPDPAELHVRGRLRWICPAP